MINVMAHPVGHPGLIPSGGAVDDRSGLARLGQLVDRRPTGQELIAK